ncbi:MAG: lipo-like protein [Betaproteobacteria bacterium]|nr:lipo-like protein [Betaproteobacteria bacterium]
MLRTALRWLGVRLAGYLSQPGRTVPAAAPTDLDLLSPVLQPGDVLLVEGTSRLSTAIKYLTQSTWSHAALYIGDALAAAPGDGEARCFIEADVKEGVRAVALSAFSDLHLRICRPVGLSAEDRKAVIGYCIERVGNQYDLKNVLDLMRYLFPTPPVPTRFRRRMLALGSGDPTRAICSTLIARAFQNVRYPILPAITREMSSDPNCSNCVDEILHIRHYSLFAPRDFDVSPYFEIVKPTLEAGFDYRALHWEDAQGQQGEGG